MNQKFTVTFLLLVLTVLCLPFDRALSHFVETLPRTPLYYLIRDLSDLGKAMWYVVGTIVLYALFSGLSAFCQNLEYKEKFTDWAKYFGFAALTLCVSGVLEIFLKMLIGRGRPAETADFSNMMFHPISFDHLYQSFPSGHTQTAFTCAFLVAARARSLRIPALLFGIFIAWTRIMQNAHFLSDTVGGLLIAWLGLLLTQWLVEQETLRARLRSGEPLASLGGVDGKRAQDEYGEGVPLRYVEPYSSEHVFQRPRIVEAKGSPLLRRALSFLSFSLD